MVSYSHTDRADGLITRKAKVDMSVIIILFRPSCLSDPKCTNDGPVVTSGIIYLKGDWQGVPVTLDACALAQRD